jgi:hypothetical protein
MIERYNSTIASRRLKKATSFPSHPPLPSQTTHPLSHTLTGNFLITSARNVTPVSGNGVHLYKNVALSSAVYTDGLKTFAGLQEAGFQHVPRPSAPANRSTQRASTRYLPLADRAIKNLQQWLIGTYLSRREPRSASGLS